MHVTSNGLFYLAVAIIVACSIYLTMAKGYKTGFIGALGMGLSCIFLGPMFFDYLAGNPVYDAPWAISLGLFGCALFRLQHATRYRMWDWKPKMKPPGGSPVPAEEQHESAPRGVRLA